MDHEKLEVYKRDAGVFAKVLVAAWITGAIFEEASSRGGQAFGLLCYVVAVIAGFKLFVAVSGFLTYRFSGNGRRNVQIVIAATSAFVPGWVLYSFDNGQYRMWEWHGYSVPLVGLVTACVLTASAYAAGEHLKATNVQRWGLGFAGIAGVVLAAVLIVAGNSDSERTKLQRELRHAVTYEQKQDVEDQLQLVEQQHIPSSAVFVLYTLAAYAGMCFGLIRIPARKSS